MNAPKQPLKSGELADLVASTAAQTVKALILKEAGELKPFPTMRVAIPKGMEYNRYEQTKTVPGILVDTVQSDVTSDNEYYVLQPDGLLRIIGGCYDRNCENILPTSAEHSWCYMWPEDYVKRRRKIFSAIEKASKK